MRRLLIVLLAALAPLSGCNTPAEPAALPSSTAADVGQLRIVSLAPHLAELVFAVGAGDLLVGVTAYTDYPDAAAALPLIGDAFAIDQEQLAVLKPDLLLAWKSGTPAHVVDELRKRGYRVETIRTQGLNDVASALEHLGRLTGRETPAADAAKEFRQGIEMIASRYSTAQPISVFYQVSNRPLYTVNRDHFVSQLIDRCGGRNIFRDLNSLAPLVDVEAVLARNPEVLLASDDAPADAFGVWNRWPELAANRYGNRFFLPANEIGRATPRLVLAGKTLCAALEKARRNRAGASGTGPGGPRGEQDRTG